MQGSYSEQVLEQILLVRDKDKCSLFDACLIYCEREGIDVEDLTENIDDYSKELLRQSALEERKVRQCDIPKKDVLEFE